MPFSFVELVIEGAQRNAVSRNTHSPIRRNSTVRFNPNVKGRNTYFQNGKGGKKNHETDQFTTRSRYNDRVVIRSVSLRPHLLQKSRLNGLPQLPSLHITPTALTSYSHVDITNRSNREHLKSSPIVPYFSKN